MRAQGAWAAVLAGLPIAVGLSSMGMNRTGRGAFMSSMRRADRLASWLIPGEPYPAGRGAAGGSISVTRLARVRQKSGAYPRRAATRFGSPTREAAPLLSRRTE